MSIPDFSDRRTHPTVEHAIETQNGVELQACLDRGWDPEGPLGPEGRPTYPLVDRIIFRGWLEGWQILRARWPNLALEVDLVRRVFSRLQSAILKDMLDQKAFTADQPLIDGKSALTLSIEALGMAYEVPPGEEHNLVPFDQRAVSLFGVLAERGVDPYLPLPGVFHPDDTEMAGHSVWTRALFNMRWTLGLQLMPTDLNDVQRQPRLNLALNQMLEEARNRHHPSRSMAQSVYALWIARFGSWWFKQPDVVAPHLHNEWSFIIGLPQASRKIIWEAWGLLQEYDMNIFHNVAQEAKSKDILPVLQRLLADIGEPQAWQQPSVEGIRPCDLWALVLDGSLPEQPWTLAQALENTRQRGNGLLHRSTT